MIKLTLSLVKAQGKVIGSRN